MSGPSDVRRNRLRNIALAWAALIALMLTSLASAYVPLGAGNLFVGVGIAVIKAWIVLAIFMGLARATPVLRLAAAIGFCALAVLLSLSLLDDATRDLPRAPVQKPAHVAR
jgi:cytochrome c oxidase subunit 4